MASEYAKRTTVPISKSKTEIEALLKAHGADGFTYSTEGDYLAMVKFRMAGLYVRIVLTMPSIEEYARTPGNIRRPAGARQKAWDQACRQRWRALLLIIRAKLEAVQSGIATLESEFLANIILPEGRTVGEWVTPHIQQAYANGRMPPMLAEGSKHGE